MENEVRYLYSVNPKRHIKSSVPELNGLRVAKTLNLTKEEVIECLKYASVYRRFSVNKSVKVNIMNIDRLHNATFIEGEEREVKPEYAKDESSIVVNTDTIIAISNNKEIKPQVEEISEPQYTTTEDIVESLVEEIIVPEVTAEDITTDDNFEEVVEEEVNNIPNTKEEFRYTQNNKNKKHR